MFASFAARWRTFLILGLVLLALGFFVSTLYLFGQSLEQRRELGLSIRASGWVSYQAVIEFVKFEAELEICAQAVLSCDAKTVGLRAALLASRLKVLSDSDEGNQIPTIEDYRSRLRAKFDELARMSDTLQSGSLHRLDADALRAEQAGLGEMLQQLLRDATLYNSDIEARQALLRAEPTWAFLLLVATGLGLIGLQTCELRQRTRLLDQVQALHRAEQLRQEEMVQLFEALPQPVIVTGPDSLAHYTNLAARHFLEDACTTSDKLLEGLTGPHLKHIAEETQEVPFVTASGSVRLLSLAAASVAWKGAPATVLVISDNTETRDSELRAMAVGKLAVLGELASGIAHELNQPLAVIRAAAGNGVMISERMEQDALRDKFAKIDAQVSRAGRIVQTILQFGYSGPTAKASFSILRTMHAAFGLIGHQYKLAGIELQLDLSIPLDLCAQGDATLLEIALLNILINARDAFEESEQATSGRRVKVTARREGRFVDLVIADNAGGISDAVMSRIFSAFVTTKAPGKGTGLGMSIARRAIVEMGGTIEAGNQNGGARFHIILPATLETSKKSNGVIERL